MVSDISWFHDARYGMFIHWGPYSVAGRGEWVRNREKIPQAEYSSNYADRFLAEHFDPKEWVRLAQDSGMKYVILTTRHHDGFCLWDTKTTQFNAMHHGAKRDLVRAFADAVREAGLKLGFYYSVADWSHPDYPDAYERDWLAGWPDEAARQRFVRYYHSQLKELMTEYGTVDLLWYDGCIPSPTDGEEINTLIKSLQPQILINERNGKPYDFECSEQAIKPASPGTAWEACLTLNDNWGYHAGDTHYKSAFEVIQMLTETAASAGNLLLNVGPRSDGSIPEASAEILRDVGKWLAVNGEFLSHSTRSPFSWNNWGRLTTKGSRIYLHIFHSPGQELCLAEIKNPVCSVHFLASGATLPFTQRGDRLFIQGLPVPLPDILPTTLVIEVEGEPEVLVPQTSSWIAG